MADPRVRELLDMQDALERFAPWAGNVRERDDAESGGAARLFDVDSFRLHWWNLKAHTVPVLGTVLLFRQCE